MVALTYLIPSFLLCLKVFSLVPPGIECPLNQAPCSFDTRICCPATSCGPNGIPCPDNPTLCCIKPPTPPPGEPCPSWPCAANETCLVGTTCCADSDICGPTCCPAFSAPTPPPKRDLAANLTTTVPPWVFGNYCANNVTGLCCAWYQTDLGGICCDAGQFNCGGVCCTGTCSPDGLCSQSPACAGGQTCNVESDCPANYDCSGVCCEYRQ